jgi:hypothetical protein
MLSHFSVFPPLSESPLEVSDVCPNSQSFSIDLERRVVLRQKHQFDLAARQIAPTDLGAKSAAQKLGARLNGDGCSKANTIALSRLQS